MQSYDYAHRSGIIELSWDDFAGMTRRLAEGLGEQEIDIISGTARAGLFPAAALACALRLELFPIRLSRREHDVVVHDSPVWKVPMPEEVDGKVVAVVDEIADTGETLHMAAEAARQKGAKQVITVALVAHSWATPRPDVVALVSDALVVFPWDQEVLVEGRWVQHPELVEARAAQGTEP